MVSPNSIILGLIVAALSGCSGTSLNRTAGDPALPKELPEQFKNKFEVRDAPLAASIPTPIASALPPPLADHSPKKKRKSKLSKKESFVPTALVIPNRRPAKEPIWVGEKLVFEVTYFGMSAGEFSIEVLPFKAIGQRKVYHMLGQVKSSSVFSLFYRLDDSIETFMDYEGIFSYRFHLILDETKQKRDGLELYDYDKMQTFYWNKWNHIDRGYQESKDYGVIQPWSQDSVSALFYIRTLPLTNGAVYTFPVVSEGKGWEAVVTVVRREMLDTPMGKVQTIVLKPETKFQGVLQKRGDSFIWVTDDVRRFPVRIEAKVKIGTVVGSLKKVASYGTQPVEGASASPVGDK